MKRAWSTAAVCLGSMILASAGCGSSATPEPDDAATTAEPSPPPEPPPPAPPEVPVGEQTGQSAQVAITKTVEVDYLLFLPRDYESQDRWPLMMFLHGAGERGDDLERVAVHGPPKIVKTKPDFPFILVSPLCPAGRWWEPEPLAALLDELIARYRVDEDRIYLTGLSMGGFGTWALACAHPDRFAAIAPICGGGDPDHVSAIKHVPVWVFHGDQDSVVPIKNSEAMVEALRACGGNVKFARYEGVGHDAWTATYDNPELYTWFLSHRRHAPARTE